MYRLGIGICLLLLSASSSVAQDRLVIQRAFKKVVLTGYTRSDIVMTLSSEVSGKVLEVHYDIGGRVEKKAFYEIDPTFIDLQIQSTLHSLQNIETRLKKNQSRVAYLTKEFERMERLFRDGTAAESSWDLAAEDLSQARLEGDSIIIEGEVLKATLQELRERKTRHKIYAPEGWIVVEKMVEAGEIVSIGTPLARVGDFENLVVPLTVSDMELEAIQAMGNEINIIVQSRRAAKAELKWVNPEFDEKTRKLSIELALPDFEGPKRGGLPCQLSVRVRREGLMVPKEAVLNRYENPRVTLGESGKAVQVTILGESEGHFIVAEDERLRPGIVLRGW